MALAHTGIGVEAALHAVGDGHEAVLAAPVRVRLALGRRLHHTRWSALARHHLNKQQQLEMWTLNIHT